jgi:antitoxin VapB
MALNIKNPEVERLASEVAKLAKETKTEAIRRALIERRARLEVRHGSASKRNRIESLLRDQIWPTIPADVLGTSISKEDEEQILGYGPAGV